jgi:hypothetical protein
LIIKFLTVERNAAVLLLVSAVLGLVAYNTGLAPEIDAARNAHFAIEALHLDLTLDKWLGEFFIAFFFLLVGLELKREFVFTRIELKQVRNRFPSTDLTQSATEATTHKVAPTEMNTPKASARIIYSPPRVGEQNVLAQ